jgi:hypothetical protein
VTTPGQNGDFSPDVSLVTDDQGDVVVVISDVTQVPIVVISEESQPSVVLNTVVGHVGPAGPAGPAGEPGEQGPPGPWGGEGNVSYRHYQTSPADTWTVEHDLPFRPNVTVVDSTGREVWPGVVEYPNDLTVQLTFSAAFGGEAYLS